MVSKSMALISGNTIGVCNDKCIQINGNNGRIENNVLFGGDDGIEYDGDNPTITGNRVDSMGDDNININCGNYNDPIASSTITQTCTGGTISNNIVLGSGDDDEGIDISNAVNITIENNTIKLVAEIALDFDGENSTIRGNRIWRSGTESTGEDCMEISGNGNNTIENNQFKYCTFRAISQDSGDANTYRNNTIIGSGRAGIYVSSSVSGTIIDGNTIIGGAGEGIANNGTGTVITNNTVTGNRTDICVDTSGSYATDTGNTIETGSTSTACVVK